MSTAVNTSPASAAGEGEAQIVPSSPEVQNDTMAPAPVVTTPAAPAASVTESVTKMLLEGELSESKPVRSDAPAAKAPAKPATGPTPAAIETPAPDAKAEHPEIELPEVPHPMDDEDDPRDADIDGRASEKTRVAFDRLRGRLRQAREEGQFGSMIVNVAEANGLTPDQVGSLIALTAKAKSGDAQAATRLLAVLTELGAAAPAAPAIDKDTLLAVEAEKVYRKMFAADVDSADMTESSARAKSKMIAEERLQNQALSQPAKQETPQPRTAPAPRAAAPEHNDGLAPMERAALSKVEQLSATYASAYKAKGVDFAPIANEARELIREKAKREGPINPLLWEYEFAQAVRSIQSKRVASQTKTPVAASGLRPSGGGGIAGNTSKNDFRADIVGDLLSGKYSDR